MRNINPIQIISKAAMIRTTKTTCTWKNDWLNLQETRNDKGPMPNLAIPENSPGIDNPWWSEPAFADILFEANKTIPNNTRSTIQKKTFKKKGSTQAGITKWLKMTSLTRNLAQVIAPRINRFFANSTKTQAKQSTLHDQLKIFIAIAKTATPAAATSILRTWRNAWITSRRAQTQVAKCEFGCSHPGGKDELEHYINCPALNAPINTIIFQNSGIALGSAPGEFLTFSPHTRSSESKLSNKKRKPSERHLGWQTYTATFCERRLPIFGKPVLSRQ